MALDEVKAPELLPVPEEDAADMLRRGLENHSSGVCLQNPGGTGLDQSGAV